ncbi:hypothetical protein RCL1_004578 [Eukaryota sp. TZLM3-RCL]
MFGSAFSSRSDPALILKAMEATSSQSSFFQEYQQKLERINKKREEARTLQTSKRPSSTSIPNKFRPGDLVLRHAKNSRKLHGSYQGPFLVLDVPSNSSVSLQNLITGSTTSAAACQCKLYITDLPVTSDLHKAVASGDCEERLINRIVSVRDS